MQFMTSRPSLFCLWLPRILAAISALIFLFWGVCHLLVPSVVKNAAEAYGQNIGYEITYQDLRISPLRLRIEIDGLRVVDSHRVKLLELKKSVVMLKWSSLIVGEVGFDEIIFD